MLSVSLVRDEVKTKEHAPPQYKGGPGAQRIDHKVNPIFHQAFPFFHIGN